MEVLFSTQKLFIYTCFWFSNKWQSNRFLNIKSDDRLSKRMENLGIVSKSSAMRIVYLTWENEIYNPFSLPSVLSWIIRHMILKIRIRVLQHHVTLLITSNKAIHVFLKLHLWFTAQHVTLVLKLMFCFFLL